MTELSDTQAVILAAAAARTSGSLYPLPATITAPASAVTKSVTALISRGFAEERDTHDFDAVSRTDGDLRYGMFITPAGRQAIGIDEATEADTPSPVDPTSAATEVNVTVAPAPPHATKTAAVVALLERDGGATLPELIEATGWLPHTTRAALTGLRKKGHAIERSKRDGATCYRIAAAA